MLTDVRSDDKTTPGLTETVAQRLVQFGFSVTAPREGIDDLTVDDLELHVGGRLIEDASLDRVCNEPTSVEQQISVTFPTTFLFYVDQVFLDFVGRARAFERLRQIIPELVVSGNRGMLVANGRQLITYAEVTDDVKTLLAAVERAEEDIEQWESLSTFAKTVTTEDDWVVVSKRKDFGRQVDAQDEFKSSSREAEFIDVTRVRGTPSIKLDSVTVWQASARFRRLELILGRFVPTQPPKAVVYFGDYGGYSAAASRDLSRQAATQDIRLYTVQSRDAPLYVSTRTNRYASSELLSTGFGRSTGGGNFGPHATAESIVSSIRRALGCFYLVSFKPRGLPLDEPLSVELEVRRAKAKVRTRENIVIQSQPKRLVSQLLGAFAAPDSRQSPVDVRGNVILTGFEKGSYTALVQVAIESTLKGSSFDLGASLVTGDEVRDDLSGRITVDEPVTVVLEGVMRLPPGPFELVMVGQETNEFHSAYKMISSGTVEGELSDPNRGSPSITPVVVMQSARSVFSRGREVKIGSALARGPRDLIQGDRPAALLSLVCRGNSKKGTLQISRQLIGTAAVDFPLVEVDLARQPCAQIQDLIPANVMTEGEFRYEIEASRDGESVVSEARTLFVGVSELAGSGGEG